MFCIRKLYGIFCKFFWGVDGDRLIFWMSNYILVRIGTCFQEDSVETSLLSWCPHPAPCPVLMTKVEIHRFKGILGLHVLHIFFFKVGISSWVKIWKFDPWQSHNDEMFPKKCCDVHIETAVWASHPGQIATNSSTSHTLWMSVSSSCSCDKLELTISGELYIKALSRHSTGSLSLVFERAQAQTIQHWYFIIVSLVGVSLKCTVRLYKHQIVSQSCGL